MRTIPAAGLLLFASSMFAAVPNVRLAFDETSILPAGQTSISVFVENAAEAPLQLPSRLWLIAARDSETPFVIKASEDGEAWSIPPDQRAVAAGQTREFRFDPHLALYATLWLTDARLTHPGSYSMRAVFAEDAPRTASLTSPPAILTVIEPSGEDAAVWTWMQKKAGGTWTDDSWGKYWAPLAEFILHEHPGSNYSLYVCVYGILYASERPTPFAEEAMKRFDGQSFTDQVKAAVAEAYMRGHDAMHVYAIGADLAQHSRSITMRALGEKLQASAPQPNTTP